MNPPEIIITEDGSHSLKVDGLDEHYHSTFGALAESRHVFIEAGLKRLLSGENKHIDVLEIGLGTGLNALLTIIESIPSGKEFHYTALEPYPLQKNIWGNLNYPELISNERAGDLFNSIHQADWNLYIEIATGFHMAKMKCALQDYNNEENLFDLLYFDAFGPDIQPDMWTDKIFQKISDMTRPAGILVTYSAKGSVRRALQNAGFEVERIPGPKGKREMIRGVKL
jgi:tRNA U34 5-methylaminomethyl-2-thiouridine-forming methyltransferase MnmC